MGDNPELEELLSELNEVEKTKWRLIGKYLGLRDEVLEAITKDPSDPQNQLTAMLIERRKSGSLPWSAIIETLEDKTVGEDGLALRLRMKYETEVDEQPRKIPRFDTITELPNYSTDMFVTPKRAESYKCVHCKSVPGKPHQSQCEHNILSCEACVHNKCPTDGCNWTVYKYDSKKADKIRRLMVYCPNKTAGCEEKMPFSTVGRHLEQCPQQEIPCTYRELGCTETVKRGSMHDHVNWTNIHLEKAGEAILKLKQEKKTNLVPPLQFKIGPVRKGRYQKKTLVTDSTPFYSHQHGYRLTMKLGIHVNLKQRLSQFNILLCSVQGENDDSLIWPFKGTMSLALLNHTENRDHCVSEIKFSLEKGSKSQIVEKRFDPPSKYVTEGGDGVLNFCISKIEIDEESKPWLTDPSAIDFSG